MGVYRAYLIIGNNDNASVIRYRSPTVWLIQKTTPNFDDLAPITARRTQIDMNGMVRIRH